MHHELTERPEDHKRKEAADGVAEDERGAGRGQPATGTHEEPGADSATDRDHLDLSGLEALVVALILDVEGGFGGMGV